jgi:hypothetical protein
MLRKHPCSLDTALERYEVKSGKTSLHLNITLRYFLAHITPTYDMGTTLIVVGHAGDKDGYEP